MEREVISGEPDLTGKSFKRGFRLSLRFSCWSWRSKPPYFDRVIWQGASRSIWELRAAPAGSLQENGASELNCASSHLSSGEDLKFQEGTHPGQHRDGSLVTSWAQHSAKPCLGLLARGSRDAVESSVSHWVRGSSFARQSSTDASLKPASRQGHPVSLLRFISTDSELGQEKEIRGDWKERE